MRLTVLVPDLLWPEPGDKETLADLPCPGLEWLLARGEVRREAPVHSESTLAACFGIAGKPPLAALRLLGEPLTGYGPNAREGYWLCADPVHLRFHHERIVLADAGAFDLTDDEAHALAIALNQTFADIGEFHVTAARRWYLRLHAPVDHEAAPLSAVAGRRMDGDLPEGGQPSSLRRWLNEIQMFLHGHPVNEARQAAGQPAINSLWLWGGGSLAESQAPAFTSVWSSAPLAVGLARATRIPALGLPDRLATLLAAPEAGDHPLVVLDSLQGPVLYEDGDGWRSALQALEAAWFSPLRQALGGRVTAIDLVAPTIYGQLTWTIGAGDRWKLWRRPQALAALATHFATTSVPAAP